MRAEAARVLGTLGEPAKAAVPALIEAGHDEVGSVSRSARAALRKIGTPEAVKAVEQFGAREKLALQLLRFGIPWELCCSHFSSCSSPSMLSSGTGDHALRYERPTLA